MQAVLTHHNAHCKLLIVHAPDVDAIRNVNRRSVRCIGTEHPHRLDRIRQLHLQRFVVGKQ